MEVLFQQIKLVIWDLDECFWKGTLSEGTITPIEDNVTLIKDLTNRGIVNTICSKNSFSPVEKQLEKLQLNDLFVFKSIDWTPKGQRISSLIKEMGLRPQNCLFIDDNIVNLNEALYYEPELMIMEPSQINNLREYFLNQPCSDLEHKRLNNYKVLEKKVEAKKKSSSNLEFLYQSQTQVTLHTDCGSCLDRIYELVNRTNQLNYTKVRAKKEELSALISDESIQCGYVTVKDKFGDYGIVGFYAVKDNECLHFLFSCRTIGQGVEQYVYAILGFPKINVIGDVVNELKQGFKPDWINADSSENISVSQPIFHQKIVFKGGCDLKSMMMYLNSDRIIEEFTYIGRKHNNIEHFNSSVNYLTFPFFSEKEKKQMLTDCIFNDEDMFRTSIYDKDVSIIFISTLIDVNLGVYRNKQNGLKVAFGESLYPLTDRQNWNLYIENKIFTANNVFTKEWLQQFSEKYEFEGTLTPLQMLENYKYLLRKVSPTAKVCFLLGSEIPFKKNTQKNYVNRHLKYKEINDLLRTYANDNDRVLLIDFNEFLKSQDDFTDNINHFTRRVYYAAATRANEYISACTGNGIIQKGHLYLYWKTFIDRIGETGLYQTKLYAMFRHPISFLKSFFKF